MNDRRTTRETHAAQDHHDEAGTKRRAATTRDDAVRRLALFLEQSPEDVESNVANAMQLVLCRLPWESRLRRSRDEMLLMDIRFLVEEMESDDIRRPRLRYLLEHAERRARM